MSYTEINDEKGMRHGGMPYDAILGKLEETDPELVDAVSGRDKFDDIEDAYGNATRAEIIDWAPDAPVLESDHPRRDPAWSRSALNLRYNGTRGSHYELPQHPELFIGFTGDDPRGVTNDPRFDQIRGHITARAANLEARMGNNDDNTIAERPWTAQSQSYAMKELHKRVQKNTKVFLTQKEGRPYGRNTVLNDLAQAKKRRIQAASAENKSQFFAGDHKSANGVVGINTGWGQPQDTTAAARQISLDADLPFMYYGQVRGGGDAMQGRGNKALKKTAQDQDYGQSTIARAANSQILAATMANAAKAAAAGHGAKFDTDYGESAANVTFGKANTAVADVAKAYRNVKEDAERGSDVGDLSHAAVGAGYMPTLLPSGARVMTTGHSIPSINATAIVRGLREGTAAGRRGIAKHVIPTTNFKSGLTSGVGGKSVMPSDDTVSIQKHVQVVVGGDGLTVHNYKSAPPLVDPSAAAQGSVPANEFGSQKMRESFGKTAPLPTEDAVAFDAMDVGDLEFGRVDERQSHGTVGYAPLARVNADEGVALTDGGLHDEF
jgi:hypothetical protein